MVQAHGYETYIHEFVPSSSAIYEHDVQLVPSGSVIVPINITKPENYDLPIYMEIKFSDINEHDDSFSELNNLSKYYKVDTLLVSDISEIILYSNNLIIATPIADYLFPESRTYPFSYFNNGTADLNFDLVYEGIAFYDNFDNSNNWNLNSNWNISNGFLISRSPNDSFYLNQLVNNTVTNSTSILSNWASELLVIETRLKNELEWDNDYFNINLSERNYIRLNNQKWENYNILSRSQIPVNSDMLPSWDGLINISLESDSSLNYRGVEIDYLKVLFKPQEGCNKGDVNHDGIVNVIDIVNIVNFIFEIATPEYYQECTSDINNDNIINVLDVVLVVDSIFGIDN